MPRERKSPAPTKKKNHRRRPWYEVVWCMEKELPASMEKELPPARPIRPSETEAEFPHYARALRAPLDKKRKAYLDALRGLYIPLDDVRLAAREREAYLARLGGGRTEIEDRGAAALVRFDNALLECVHLDRTSLFREKWICARIAAAEVLKDNSFFERLGSSVRRLVTPHKRTKLSLVRKAAGLLDQGLSFEEVYDGIEEAAEMGPKEFRRHLRRHGVNLPKKQKPSGGHKI